jgi:hypothetical protein
MPRFQPFEQPADDLDMEACTCGARLLENAAWCPVCLKVPVDRDDLIEELHDTFRKTTWATPERFMEPSPPPVYSRWRAGPRSFGIRVKLAFSIVTVGLTAVGVKFFGFFLFAPWIIATSLLMYSTWMRERVR